MTIVLRGYIRVPAEDLDEVRGALDEHIRLTRLEEGCLRFDVLQDDADPLRFNVHEEFGDQRAFDAHQQRMRASRWREVSENAARHYEISRDE